MTYEEFINYWLDYFAANPEQRAGQAFFNALYFKRPDLADQVRATIIDPFYENSRLPLAENWIEAHW